MIKYIGSKRALVGWIEETILALPDTRSVIDLFSGTSRVGHALKRRGLRVLANDHNAYASTLARCYVGTDDDRREEVESLVRELATLPPVDGYFTETYCRQSRYFQEKNGRRIDAMRARIAALSLDPALEAVMLTSLMEAADRVDSTTGVQMAYLKSWSSRSGRDLTLRVPDLLPRSPHGAGEAHRLDAVEAAGRLSADVAYLDPPYNQHRYHGNYHVWETLVLADAPEVFGIAQKRVDTRARRSRFNVRREIADALTAVVDQLDVAHLVVSFSDEGHLTRDELERILSRRGTVRVESRPHRRYIGSQIGVFNLRGEKVGEAGHASNTEHLFVVSTRR